MKKNILPWIIVTVIIVGAVAAIYQFNSSNQAKPELNAFAQCVTAKGWTMYGAYWCGHCQKEKANYGSAFQYINYVECTKEVQLCTEKKVEGYPTWLGPNDARETGEVGLKKMAELSGCELPI
jgi:hypothetical protein